MKQQKINAKKPPKQPVVIDQRQPDISLPEIPNSNVPVRAVVFVEVGDMDQVRVQCLIQEINKIYRGSRGGIHYVIPVRDGKIRTDIVFENEFLDVVNQLCEIRDNKIVFQDDAAEVKVLRELIK